MPSRRDLCSTLLILVMTASFGVIPAFADYRTPQSTSSKRSKHH